MISLKNDKDIYISGSAGITFMNSKNKKILLLHDVHDGVNYCANNINHIDIDKYFREKNKHNQLILEETVDSNIKLTDLWPNARHTQNLKLLANEKINNLYSVDIRPYLIPYSWELIKIDKNKFGKLKLKEYLKFIDILFYDKNKSKVYNLFLKDLEIKNKLFKQSTHLHFEDIKNIIEMFKNSNDLNKDIDFFYNNKINILYQLNNILSAIMEWYIILLALSSNKNSIIHAGLAHSNRIKKLLKKFYNFEIEYDKGLTGFENLDLSKNINSCVLLPKNINSRFNTKFGFY